ncbi:uncharacterized protein LOC111203889 [Brassica napus]|uniref:(rape) hypothetical protein n=1 Tax=Brassica napus TaxID=3708 RepID=A0A817B8Z8_BRANA|nr:uncharacterized protein LOC111203889 [Brassica napus]CAF2338920.1 unnamed protein product [Brassica napus]
MTRFLLELITLEKQDGNSKGKNLSEQGKQNVLKEFKKQFPVAITWNKVKNRLDTLKKQYEIYPSKFRSHPLRFIPLLDVVFRDETVVVEESWQPRRGVYHRTPRVELSDEEEVQIQDSHDLDHMEQDDTAWLETPMKDTPNVIETDLVMPSQQSMKDTSRRKRKRNPVDSTLDRIAATMEDRNGILEQMASSTSKSKSTNATEERMALVVKCVRGVPDLIPMTELYWASLDLIATNDVVRGLFMALPDDEKLPFLKRQTKESRNDFFDD